MLLFLVVVVSTFWFLLFSSTANWPISTTCGSFTFFIGVHSPANASVLAPVAKRGRIRRDTSTRRVGFIVTVSFFFSFSLPFFFSVLLFLVVVYWAWVFYEDL
ncbi:hypothetical protein CFOL_v3_08745 [Cephalotus follicularis]|uniref:Transmembrane protein n=1 Tax=Cephalotus follicularis TaxID=3775 RepID=A0A1Q3BB51_CEPFO|nr:hypothetical protein CFOL_v3_08745 [Cephalotus follicularis]